MEYGKHAVGKGDLHHFLDVRPGKLHPHIVAHELRGGAPAAYPHAQGFCGLQRRGVVGPFKGHGAVQCGFDQFRLFNDIHKELHQRPSAAKVLKRRAGIGLIEHRHTRRLHGVQTGGHVLEVGHHFAQRVS